MCPWKILMPSKKQGFSSRCSRRDGGATSSILRISSACKCLLVKVACPLPGLAASSLCTPSKLRSWIPGLKRMYGGKTFILGSRPLMRRWARLKTRTVVFDSVAAGAGAAGVITVLGCCWAAFYRTARTVHSSFPRAITVLKIHGIPWASRVLDPTTLWWKMFLCLITAPINKPMGLKGLTPE